MWRRWRRFGSERDAPKAIGGVAPAYDDDVSIFVDVHVVFGEKSDTVIIAELANGDEGARFEVVENVTNFRARGELGG